MGLAAFADGVIASSAHSQRKSKKGESIVYRDEINTVFQELTKED